MILRIGVGLTEEWVERARPALLEAGFVQVAQAVVPGSDGEFIECDFDLEARGVLSLDDWLRLVRRIEAIVDESMVPHVRWHFHAS